MIIQMVMLTRMVNVQNVLMGNAKLVRKIIMNAHLVNLLQIDLSLILNVFAIKDILRMANLYVKNAILIVIIVKDLIILIVQNVEIQVSIINTLKTDNVFA